SEYGGRRADAEPQSERGDGGEARRAAELPPAEDEVLAELAEELEPPSAALTLLAQASARRAHGGQVAEAAQGLRPRLLLAHASGHQVAYPHREVEVELLLDLLR